MSLQKLAVCLFVLCCFHSLLALDIHPASLNEEGCPYCTEEFLKNITFVSVLTSKCKSDWEAQGGNEQDKNTLMNYALYFCRDMPEDTHPINKSLLIAYMTTPMLNTAFLRGWSRLNPNLVWPICVVCSLGYHLDPYWEKNFSFCE